MTTVPTAQDLRDAAARIAPYAHRTPVLTSTTLNERLQAELFFKCENLQKIGAFKFRGATNALRSMPPEQIAKGVATHSSGNHAQAVALAAKMLGVPAYIVMPETAPIAKVNAVRGYGAEITFCPPTLEARETTCAAVIERTGATMLHAYDDYRIIAGQATAAMELIEDLDNLDIIMAPVGGGGLLSGTALAAHYFAPEATVIAGEPKGADDAKRSMDAGELIPSVNPQTIADGLLTSLGSRNFDIIRRFVSRILTAEEATIVEAMKLVWERMKIVVEPSAAVPLAALFENPEVANGKRIGIIFSGGNVDLEKLPW